MIYEERLDDRGRFLALALRGQRTPAEDDEVRALYRRLGEDECRALARANQCLAPVAVTLGGLLDGEARTPWDESAENNEARVRSLVERLVAIVAALDGRGVASAVIEAGGVLLGSDLPLGAYAPGDLDLLVSEDGWDATQEVFSRAGFVHEDRRGRPTKRIEFTRLRPDGQREWLEVGSAPFDRMWVPLRFRDRSPAWLARRVPSRKEARLSVLAPADALALVSIHTSLHSYVRAPGIRLHMDVDRLVRDNVIDWPGYVDEIRRVGATRRAFVSLAMAAGLLGTPIPGDVLEDLAPSSARWRRIRRLLASEGVVADGRPKLTRVKSVLLDVLIDEDGVARWAGALTVPEPAWMREHFDRQNSGAPLWRLHARRVVGLISRWSPR